MSLALDDYKKRAKRKSTILRTYLSAFRSVLTTQEITTLKTLCDMFLHHSRSAKAESTMQQNSFFRVLTEKLEYTMQRAPESFSQHGSTQRKLYKALYNELFEFTVFLCEENANK